MEALADMRVPCYESNDKHLRLTPKLLIVVLRGGCYIMHHIHTTHIELNIYSYEYMELKRMARPRWEMNKI